MQSLDRTSRNKLERTVIEARDVAEDASRAALEQLGGGDGTPMKHLSPDERTLRKKLRAHGRQLGDIRNEKSGRQEIERLIEEVAYQHWHRMLFARFLAENNLLMYPHSNNSVPITLEECEELAPDEGAKNGWELASRYAGRMLPQIFRISSPVFQLTLPPEHQQKLEQLIEELPAEVYTASDSLGWVYQFWQTKKKEAVNKSGVKIGRRELPAVTQLFTEPYMVAFLLDNSLGAWWAGKCLTEDDLRNAESEEQLRQKAALPGMPLEYLRFVKEDDGLWKPAAGTFDDWPDSLQDFKALDPCCGSGHFLVVMFMMLVAIRIEMEKLSPIDAVDAVLQQNLHGLELDQRCVELAAFAVAFAAWKYPNAGGYRPLPDLNIACSGLALNVSKETWQQVAARAADKLIREDNNELFPGEKDASLWHTRLIEGMNALYDLFQNAPELGSLIRPETIKSDIFQADYEQTQLLLEQVLKIEEKKQNGSEDELETAVTAYGLSRSARMLADKYTLVATNVPYLARGKQGDILFNYCNQNYRDAKNDLATVFLQRCLEYCHIGGTASLVLPQSWLYLSSFRNFRRTVLKCCIWHLVTKLGSGAFETISGEIVKAILFILSKNNVSVKKEGRVNRFSDFEMIRGLKVYENRGAVKKATHLLTSEIKEIPKSTILQSSDSVVVLDSFESFDLLVNYANSYKGLDTGDLVRFIFHSWEVNNYQTWAFFSDSPNVTGHYGGMDKVVYWEKGEGILCSYPNANIRGRSAWNKKGINSGQMNELPVSIYTGSLYGVNSASLIPHKYEFLTALWCFCSSIEYSKMVRRIDQSLKVTNATLVKIPFDSNKWMNVASEKYPNGLPQPYSDDPTQWIFHGHPCGSVVWNESTKQLEQGELRLDSTVLQVSVARMLGYRWPAELDPEMELSEESREWVKKSEELLEFADEDGIVCIPPVRGEPSARDRLLNLMSAAYGDAWSNDIRIDLLKSVDHDGKTLETWLRDKFFIQHCQLFHHRPFIWQVWDGLPDGFSVLVNYHKLDHKNLETLIYTYLGDWISRQKQDQAAGIDGAGEKLAAAENLKKQLELILEGEEPYDIFVRWKPIEEQPIGWEPDLNDGVRLNIRPFMSVPDIRKKGAGVLRDKPNIKWTKDRGKDVESAPWYHLFKGERINDHHLSLEEKRTARKNKKEAK